MRSPWLLVCVGGTPKPKKAVKPDEAEKALAEFKRATDRLREMVEAEKILGVEVRTNAVPRLNAVHNTDFTMVKWFGTEYHFALGVQSLAVRALWEEWDRSGLGLHQETIRDAIDAERDK